ncbi:MAG: helix-turn-helix domain-containing protein [Balneolaceae bacterium]|nr:helix-turn-helix domain-containing protein [Balneolaceae bacterium]
MKRIFLDTLEWGIAFNLTINNIDLTVGRNNLICLTPLQEPDISNITSDYYLLLFNREFYCIHEKDHEVSFEGLLFWGSSELPVLRLDDQEILKFETLFQGLIDELDTRDRIQGEMLRMLLKRLIIKSTRLARKQFFLRILERTKPNPSASLVYLVEQHYKEHHQVDAYPDMLHKSPKTLSNVFAEAGHKTPLEMIYYRMALEGKRQLLKTDKVAKEIAYDLGFTEHAHFSRFFKKETGMSPSAYRKSDQKS